MKRLLLALLLAACSAYAYAEGVANTNNSDPATQSVAAASYVNGAYKVLNEEKIGRTITQQIDGNTITGNIPEGTVVTNVSVNTNTDADNNTQTTGLTVTRSNVKIPNNSATNTSDYSAVWIE